MSLDPCQYRPYWLQSCHFLLFSSSAILTFEKLAIMSGRCLQEWSLEPKGAHVVFRQSSSLLLWKSVKEILVSVAFAKMTFLRTKQQMLNTTFWYYPDFRKLAFQVSALIMLADMERSFHGYQLDSLDLVYDEQVQVNLFPAYCTSSYVKVTATCCGHGT